MTTGPTPTDGVSRFIADLADEGHEPTRYGDVVRYCVVPVSGALAGQKVVTGVSAGELQAWPSAPPHWMHLAVEINFTSTNTDATDCPAGWRRHSRDTGVWAMDRKPILTWISHLRGFLGEAI